MQRGFGLLNTGLLLTSSWFVALAVSDARAGRRDRAMRLLLGAFACGIVPFLAWKKGEMGGGDVKLFAAIGALVGPVVGFDVEARTFAFSLLVLFPYRLIRHRAVGVALRNMRIGVVNVFRSRDAREPYLTGPKLPPVILAPAIGIAFAVTLLQHGALR
jgi:prepilin peptidase CpaA